MGDNEKEDESGRATRAAYMGMFERHTLTCVGPYLDSVVTVSYNVIGALVIWETFYLYLPHGSNLHPAPHIQCSPVRSSAC
jgi:hypothetical protein